MSRECARQVERLAGTRSTQGRKEGRKGLGGVGDRERDGEE